MRFSILAFLLVFFISNCTNKGTSSKSQQMYNEVMQVHDEVMPKMKDLRQLTKELKKIENFEENKEIVEAINVLSEAKDGMMDWMAQFDMPKGGDEAVEIKFLEGQKLSVKAMSDQMYEALAQGQKVLDNHNR